MSNYKLSNCQKEVVDKAVESYFNNENIIIKAVTGSGKTFMMTNIISEILNKIPVTEKTAIIVATLSTSGLHEEIFNKFEKYIPTFPYDKRFDYELVKSPSSSKISKMEDIPSIPLENRKVIILGKSSFGKSGKLMQDKFDEFILDLQNYDHVLYFRDEAHIGISSKNNKSIFEQKLNEVAKFKCFLSATPNFDPNFKLITLTEKDLWKDNIKLIKNKQNLINFDEKLNYENITSNDLLKNALDLFSNEIVQEYKKHGYKTPAMLIQVSDNSNVDELKHNEFINNMTNHMNLIIEYCNKYNLKYYINFDDLVDIEKTNSKHGNLSLNEIGKDDNDIHIIIFKLGASVGWDIPRACVLVQLRDVFSEKLNIQTIGRIKRHPYPELEDANIYFDNYWIYSNNNIDEKNLLSYSINPEIDNKNLVFVTSVIKNKKHKKIDINLDSVKEECLKIIHPIENFINHLTSDFEKNTIYIEPKKFKETKIGYSKKEIKDLIGLKIYNDENIKDNLNEVILYITNQIINYVNVNNLFDFEQIRYSLFKNYGDYFNKILKRKFEKIIPEYEIKKDTLKVNSYLLPITDNSYIFDKLSSNHLYICNSQLNYKYCQFVDSLNEEFFGRELTNTINKLIYKDNQNIKKIIFFKNPKNSNIGTFEYMDDFGFIHTEHVDYILRIIDNNDIEKTFYMEVKGGELNQLNFYNFMPKNNDYDSVKTSLINRCFDDLKSVIDENTFLSINKIDQYQTRSRPTQKEGLTYVFTKNKVSEYKNSFFKFIETKIK